MKLPVDLTIIVVNYETPDLVNNLVESILRTIKNLNYEIIIVDNSQNQKLRFNFLNDRVKIFYLNKNKGFANASNFGAKQALGSFLLFLNSDSIVYDKSIVEPYQFLKKHKKIGVLGIRQLLENGKLDCGCKRGFPTPVASFYYFSGLSKIFKKSKRFGIYQQTFINEHSIAKVDCVSGAFMLIKSEVFNLIKGFDENFFLYGEDVDLCYRLKLAGFVNFYYGKVHFTHLKSGGNRKSLKALAYFYKSMEIFYNKHYKNKYGWLVEFLVKTAIKLKFFLSVFLFKIALCKRSNKKND